MRYLLLCPMRTQGISPLAVNEYKLRSLIASICAACLIVNAQSGSSFCITRVNLQQAPFH
jgi:hypothetical protein